jgi:arylformamidase
VTPFPKDFRIIDISQPVSEQSACFPGDTPFSREVTVSYADSQVINLTAFTMSPHVGTHADAPVHIHGDMEEDTDAAVGYMSLSPFIGPSYVMNIAPYTDAIQPEQVAPYLEALPEVPRRILFRTTDTIRYDMFETQYAWFSVALADYLAGKGVVLMGIDTPSVDHVDSKTLETHHTMLGHGMVWLENLDLTQVTKGEYFLIAAPLKLMELEASPVRAVLLAV